jgi:glycosyltransferase involved in cell wall biosynthesis
MKLLIVTNNPDRASFRQRIGIYLGMLEERSIHCQVATLPAGTWGRSRLFRQAAQFDGLLLHRKMLNFWDGLTLGRHRQKIIYDFDDAIMYNDRKPGRISRVRFARFGRSATLSDLVIAGNEYLAEHARRYGDHVQVLPTGLNLDPYRVTTPRESSGLIRFVWIGSRATLKYLRDITLALEELGRRWNNLVLRIVCDEFLDLKTMPVEKRNWSEQTEASDLMTSDIGLAPLPDNPFTRGKCGFKILQYQAAGLPVVASPVGVNGDYVRNGVTGFLAADPAQWIDRLSVLIQDAGLRKRMGQAGRREVATFDEKIIGRRFCDLIAECLGQGNDPDQRTC